MATSTQDTVQDEIVKNTFQDLTVDGILNKDG